MIEHPVPQNFTQYQFHLIGNMTIKQFLLLLVGVGLAVLIYTTNLPGILKWPLVFVAVLIGIAMAFVPYEERSLDQWIINFIRAIYRPTKYYWRRAVILPEYTKYRPSTQQDTTTTAQDVAQRQMRRSQVSQFLSTLDTGTAAAETDPLDMLGGNTDIEQMFQQIEAAENVTPGKEIAQKPQLGVRARPLRSMTTIFSQTASTPAAGQGAQIAEVMSSRMTQEELDPAPAATPAETPDASVKTVDVATISVEAAPQTQATPTDTPAVQTTEPTQDTYVASANQGTLTSDATVPAIFRTDLPFPTQPDKPNILYGMVHNAQHKSVSNAIIEILDSSGNTVRAMKTNQLGQFYISMPLKPGDYQIETEAEGSTFPVYTLTTDNTILAPIDIQARA